MNNATIRFDLGVCRASSAKSRIGAVYHAIIALLVLAAGVGCAKPVRVLDVRDNIAKWSGPKAPAPTVGKRGTIAVRIVGTPTMGWLAHALDTAPLVPVESRTPGDEVDVFKAMLEKDNMASRGLVVKGFGTAAQAILQRNLGRYFADAKVELVPSAAGSTTATIADPRLAIVPGFYTRSASFSWATTLPGAPPFVTEVATPTASAAGHLGWAIPMAIVTFPIGLGVGMFIFNSIYEGMEEDQIIEALDLASASLAVRLAGTGS